MKYTNYFKINKKIVRAIYNLMLFSMLHSSFIAPIQHIILEYYWNEQPVVVYKSRFGAASDAVQNESAVLPISNSTVTGKAVSNTVVYSRTFSAGDQEGIIGVSEEFPLDAPSDNLFKFVLDENPLPTDKVILKYELFGVQDRNAVSRSINERLATGGYIVKRQQSWSVQTEELDPAWLKSGENKIMFTTPEGASHTYKIRKLSVEIQKTISDKVPSNVVLQGTTITLGKDNSVYLKGFVKGTGTVLRVEAEGTPLHLDSNEFEGFVALNKEMRDRGFVTVRAYDNNGFLGQQLIRIGTLAEADKVFPVETEASTKVFGCSAFESRSISIPGAALQLADSSLTTAKAISITKLRTVDVAPLESGMVNVTKGGKAFRFLPDGTKFAKPVKMTLAYDTLLLPAGSRLKDIRTYYFDTNKKQWTALKTDTLEAKKGLLTAYTTHFTDYINGVIQTPESPETGAHLPNMMNDIKTADAASQITLITPPQVSQKGDATISYPIKIPAGRKGMQPQLALQYSNEGGNGWVGLGWNLALPALSIDTRWGVPLFDAVHETEIYSLAGEQLMYPRSSGSDEEYMPNRHQMTNGVITTTMQSRNTSGTKQFTFRKGGSFTTVERLGTNPTNYYWKVTNTDGTVSWYGGTETGIVESAVLRNASSQIGHWALVRTIDVYGNTINYNYEILSYPNLSSNLYGGKQQYIKDIYYTGTGSDNGNYQVEFLRKTSRPDVGITARLGLKQTESQLLENIRVNYKGNTIRSYKLTYKTGRFNKSLLDWVAEYNASDIEFYRHTFDYYDDIIQADGSESYYSNGVEYTICNEAPVIPDTDNDGIPDDVDHCPTIPGPASNHGCPENSDPDSDGDGIPDSSDGCPYAPGPISNNGCPLPGGDSDGDGIPDTEDNCPFIPGPASNNGCPVDACIEAYIKVPLQNVRNKYTILATTGFLNSGVPNYCYYRPTRIKSINVNGVNFTPPANNLFFNHYENGFANKCPGYTVTATFPNIDPVTQNPNFLLDVKPWLQNTVLPGILDSGSDLAIVNTSGLAVNPQGLYNPAGFQATFLSNATLSSGTIAWDVYDPATGNYSGGSSLPIYKQLHSANGVANNIYVNGNLLPGSPFNLYDNFAAFKSAFESLYGGHVEFVYSDENYNWASNYSARIKVNSPSSPVVSIQIGTAAYQFLKCSNKGEALQLVGGIKENDPAFLPNIKPEKEQENQNYFSNPGSTNGIAGNTYCETLTNDEFIIHTTAPSFNSAASVLGSSKTEGNNAGFALSFGIGCKTVTKNTTFGGQYTAGKDKSRSFTAMIDIDGDGLDDVVLKQSNTLFYSKHVVTRTYNANNEMSVTHAFLPYRIINGISEFYRAKSESASSNFQVTFGFSVLGGFAGIDFSRTKSETSIYFTDGNGDGLPDIVKDGVVYFNRLDANGDPQFINDSQGSPNLVITAAPKEIGVPDEYTAEMVKTPNYDVVKVWEAPFPGFIVIDNTIQLTDLAQEVNVTIEMFHKSSMTLAFGDVLNAAHPFVHHYEYLNNLKYGSADPTLRYRVLQGQRIYFRVHAKNGQNPKVDWDPRIKYEDLIIDSEEGVLTDFNQQDQNGVRPYGGASSDGFLLARDGETTIFPGRGSANIEWAPLEVYPSDTVTYEIYKKTITTANTNFNTETSTDEVIYRKVCPPGQTSIVSMANNEIGGINLAALAAVSNDDPTLPTSTSTGFYFRVVSDSNVDWKEFEWKPKMTCMLDLDIYGPSGLEDQTQLEQVMYPIPDVSVYKYYHNGYDNMLAVSRRYNTIRLSDLPIDSGANTVSIVPDFTGIYAGDDNGGINMVVKKSGIVVGKRHLTITAGNVVVNDPAPIPLGIRNQEQIEIGFYSDDRNTATTDASILKKLYLSTGTLAKIEWNGAAQPYLVKKNQVNFMHRVSQKLGTMHQQWGQFMYNPATVEGATETPYGNLIEESVLNPTINATALQNNVEYLEGLGQNITEQQLQDFQQNNQNSWPVISFMSASPLRKQNSNGAYIEKWRGYNEENYSSKNSFRAAGLLEGLSDFDYYEDQVVQDVLRTGAIAITKYSNGGSKNGAAGVSVEVAPGISVGASGSKTLDGTGTVLTDYIDLNGDGYPDLVAKDVVQYTTRTGGLYSATNSNSEINGNGGNTINNASTRGWGVAASGSFSQGGKQVGSTNGTGNGKPRFIGFKGTNGAGITGAFSKGESDTKRIWTDINGDGLADIIEKDGNGVITVRLNFGNNQYHPTQVSSNWGLTEIFNSKSTNISGGIGVNKWNGSFEAGATLGVGHNDTQNTVTDINGDGLADIVSSSDAGITVRINRGNAFAAPQLWSDFNLVKESEVQQSALNLGATIAFIIPIPFISVCLKIPALNVNGTPYSTATNKTKKTISDFDGDGFPDLVEELNPGQILVRPSNIRRTNMLKSVTNPLGGIFTMDYRPETTTYENSRAKWVMSEVKVEDGYNLVNDGFDTYRKQFRYKNARYDRREREFYGFETVMTEDYATDDDGNPVEIYRTGVTHYYNNSYFLNGLVKESYVTRGGYDGNLYSKSVNTYAIRELDAQGLITDTELPLTFDVGGSEGRKTAAVVLTKTESYLYETTATPLVKQTEMEYDEYGRIIRNHERGNPEIATDDYTTTIEYHDDPELQDKNIRNVARTITVVDDQGILKRSRTTTGIDLQTGSVGTISATTDDSGAIAKTVMEYDSFGNLARMYYPENHNGQSMWHEYTYDDENHKYVIETRDVFGYNSKASYLPEFDAVQITTDLSGNTMEYTYDSFGRLTTVLGIKESKAGKRYTIAFQYYPNYEALRIVRCIEKENFTPFAVTQHYDQQHPDDPIDTYAFIDGLGRTVQVKKDIYLTNDKKESIAAMSVSGKTYYDELGRATKQFHPYYENKDCALNQRINEYEAPYASYVDYDRLDRPVQTTDPEGNRAFMQYELAADAEGIPHLKTRSIVEQNDSQNLVTDSYTDVFGRVTSTVNRSATGDLQTSFTYNSIGELMAYTDAQHLATTYSYDMLGRKINVNHPDNGSTQFWYDGANNMTRLQTAKLAAQGQQIKYEYEFNRLAVIKYPQTPSGDNIATVRYKYGESGSGNQTGRLVYQSDATGIQEFKYGYMGEMIQNVRTVTAPNIPTRTYTTQFSYDSWNRLQYMIYPDGEKVDYSYDLGGNLRNIKGDFEYVQEINYDYYEQRTYMRYGNTTDMFYAYTPALRRLETMRTRTADQEALFHNGYKFDKIGNIKAISNQAGSNSVNAMGGGYGHSFEYDDLNRLKAANGDFNGNESQQAMGNDSNSNYSLTMAYNETHGIAQKAQRHIKNGVNYIPNSYENSYTYADGSHRLTEINDPATGTELFKYDRNGNIVDRNSPGKSIQYYWDESNRLRAVNSEHMLQHYLYDASGDRILKAGSEVEELYENGTPAGGGVSFSTYKTYPSAFIVVEGNGRYSKHYYAGSQRIVSRLGDGHAEDFARKIENKDFDEDKLRQSQLMEVRSLVQEAKMGTVTFKAYKAEEETDQATGTGTSGTTAARAPQGNIYYFHPDHLGTSTFLTDLNGNPYQFFLNLPFGETMAEQHSFSEEYESPYKFNGKELDSETGLYYYGARYYDPRISNWLSVDPMMEKYSGWNPYNYTLQNPINLTDPDGREVDDIIFRGIDKKEIRVIAPGNDVVVQLPFNVGENRMIDLSASKIDSKRFVYGYTLQADANFGMGAVGQYGGEISVANFTDDTYGDYNYIYAGDHIGASTGLQSSASVSGGVSLFVGYDDSKSKIRPSSFQGTNYSSSISSDVKVFGGAGISVSRFSSVKDYDREKGWKGVSIGLNVGIGGAINVCSFGEQVSTTSLLNKVMPTSQRSVIDKISNALAPITSSIVKSIRGN